MKRAKWTVEYHGEPADLGGRGSAVRLSVRAAASAVRRVDVWAPSPEAALTRAPHLVGGSRHRVVGRVL